jgi:hypothetical protein
MRESRFSGSVEGVVCKHDSYSDCSVDVFVEAIRYVTTLGCLSNHLSPLLYLAALHFFHACAIGFHLGPVGNGVASVKRRCGIRVEVPRLQ